MTAATPRPWFHQGSLLHGPDKGGIDIGPLRAEIYDEADAALIVRAVNAHDDLVAALRALVEASDLLSPWIPFGHAADGDRGKDLERWDAIRAEARALLRDLDASGGEEEVVIPDFGDAPVRQRGETEGYGNETDHFAFTGDEYKRQP